MPTDWMPPATRAALDDGFVVMVTLEAKDREGDAVAAILADMTPPTRAEPGVKLFLPYRSPTNPALFTIFELYVDEAGWAAHQQTRHFKTGIAELLPRLARRDRIPFVPFLAEAARGATTNVADTSPLHALNRDFVRSVQDADTGWFDRNLAPEFMNTNADGTLVDRSGFLAQIARGSPVTQLREHGVDIAVFGDFAVIRARTSFVKPDGSPGAGRYTDDWCKRDGVWRCVSAHVTRA